MTARAQRRGRAIAMTTAEVNDFLAVERTCRVATAGKDGRPHVAPLWFARDGASLWLSSVGRSQRWTDLMRDPRVAVVVDAGVEYTELRGVELSGEVVPVGEVPRTASPIRFSTRSSNCSPASTPGGSRYRQMAGTPGCSSSRRSWSAGISASSPRYRSSRKAPQP